MIVTCKFLPTPVLRCRYTRHVVLRDWRHRLSSQIKGRSNSTFAVSNVAMAEESNPSPCKTFLPEKGLLPPRLSELVPLRGPWRFLVSLSLPASVLFGALSVCCLNLVPGLAALLHVPPAALRLLSIATSFAGVWYTFGVIPMMDILLGTEELEDDEVESGAEAAAYRAVVYVYAAFNLATLCAVACLLARFGGAMHAMEMVGLLVSTGVSGGLCLTACHELLHSRNTMDNALCSFLLASTWYPHWAASHMAHHLKVGLPADPATARYGETVYKFILRSIVGNLKDGLAMERQRMQKRGLSALSPSSRLWQWVVAPPLLMLLAAGAFGPAGVAVAAAHALGGIIMLEGVNYIEHYGLVRAIQANNTPSPVTAAHSWNCNWMWTNCLTFRLQRHADHHAHGSRPYYKLRNLQDAPQLPGCYSVMLLLALLPPLWFSVMNPRVRALSSQAGVQLAPEASC